MSKGSWTPRCNIAYIAKSNNAAVSPSQMGNSKKHRLQFSFN